MGNICTAPTASGRFCLRTGIDFAALMAGRVTADELEATGQHMGIETAKNARERARHEEN